MCAAIASDRLMAFRVSSAFDYEGLQPLLSRHLLKNNERPLWVDSTYSRAEIAGFEHHKNRLIAKGCC